MIKELRIYWRLRPYINQLKELCKMRLRTNIVIQILMTLMQAYNQISDLLPAKWKDTAALVMGIIQSVVALLAHYSNPDGTPAASAYAVPKKDGIKMPSIFLFLVAGFLLCAPLQAQTDAIYVGGVANTDVTDNFKFSAQHEHLWSGQYNALWSIYTTTTYDMSGIQLRPKIDLSKMQYTATEGAETIILKPFPWMGVLAKGEIGVNGVQNTAVSLAAAGGGGLKFSHNKFVSKIYLQALKTTEKGIGFEVRAFGGFAF